MVSHFGTRLANQKVIRFDISVYQILFMDGLHAIKLITKELWKEGGKE